MSYLALYRRYRPKKFEDLIGQEHIVTTLVNQIENNRLGHAYLFTGTRGTGKTSCAKIFARAVNCLHTINGSPCGECEGCKSAIDPSNVDIMEIDAASNNGVNEIRDLREMVQYAPVSVKYKVYIIDEVHMLTGPAFNALLKTLEEPPKHAIFILATTEVHKIPATILSRCMRFDFKLIPTDLIYEHIAKIYDELNKEYEKEAVLAIAQAGEGSMRDALSIADIALSFGTGKLTYEDVTEVLGSTNFASLADFVNNIILGNAGKVLERVDNLASIGKSIGMLSKDVTKFIRDLLIIKTCDNAKDILAIPDSRYAEMKKIADSTNTDRLIRVSEVFSDGDNALRFSNQPRIVFERTAVKASREDADYDLTALLSRVKLLEDKVKQGVITNVSNDTVVDNSKIENKVRTLSSIDEISVDKAKGILLKYLRDNDNNLLWNILQNVNFTIKGDTLIITTINDGDEILLDTDEKKTIISSAFSDFKQVNVKIVKGSLTENISKVESETERLKRVFGDDIVVLK